MTTGEVRRAELARVCRVADMLCSAHAALRDRYAFRALALDVSILASSSLLAAFAFGADELSRILGAASEDIAIGLPVVSSILFALTVVQLRVSWKEQSAKHGRSFSIYSEVKHEAANFLASEEIDDAAAALVRSRYALAGEIGTLIPEGEFLRQKRNHLLKIAISRHLDSHPGASVFLTKWKFIFRDNFKNDSDRSQP